MSPQIAHIVITRFNVPTPFGPEPDDAWLRDRVDLFEWICLPSMQAQVDSDHDWLLLCGAASPDWLRERIRRWQSTTRMVAVFDDGWAVTLGSHVAELVGDDATHVLTTRLDNDDAVGSDVLATVRNAAEQHDRIALDLPSGVVVDLDRRVAKLVEGVDGSNTPFVSLMEPMSPDLETVFVPQHDWIDEVVPVIDVPTEEAAWLQVVHGKNVLNRLPKGGIPLGLHLVGPAITRRFGVDLERGES